MAKNKAEAAVAQAEQQKFEQAREESAKKLAQDALPEKLKEWSEKMASTSELADLKNLAAQATAYDKQLGGGTPGILQLVAELDAKTKPLIERENIKTNLAQIQRAIADIQAGAKEKNWTQSHEGLEAARAARKDLEKYSEAAIKAANSGDPTALLKKAEALAKVPEEKYLKQEAYKAVCGDPPTLSGWDGGNYELEAVIKETAHDPDSIDVEKCTNPILSPDNCWVLKCDVRGKNAFGAMILNQNIYSYSKALGWSQVK